MSGRHAGKIAVVTGGSSGIGQAIVRRLASEGARVAIADVADAAESVELARAAGGEAFGAPCDIAQREQVSAFVKQVEQRFGAPTIFVHSAALQFVKPFEELTAEDWRKTQAVNQESVFHFVQALLPGMKAAQWGRIILIASSTFFIGGQSMTQYVTSKGALLGFVHGLANEIGRFGITINAVAPGLTRTRNALKDLPDEFFRHITTLQAIPRNGMPEDQAGVVSFLASDDAAFMTGQTLLVDGGQGRT